MNKKTYILGPCAAESEEQIMTVAREIGKIINDNGNDNDNHNGDTIFRAGIWKPRTSPDTFQGVGEQGLQWLQRVQDELGIDTATEVSNAQQVHAAAKAHIAYLWIGARTSANPMAVEEIVGAIVGGKNEEVRGKNGVPGGTFKGIGIKNPVNNDVPLWIGNIERLERTGLPVLAIHRGCNHHPCWEMAYQLRKQRPTLPLLLDPSHMSGDHQLVSNLYQKGCQLDYNGFMIEVHPYPEQALSDAKQQITPKELAKMINANENENENENKDLLWLRAMMDEQDDAIWGMIDKRMQISKQIGDWKKSHGIDIVQPTRYQDILHRRLEWAQEHHIRAKTIQQIMDAIHTESVRVQS